MTAAGKRLSPASPDCGCEIGSAPRAAKAPQGETASTMFRQLGRADVGPYSATASGVSDRVDLCDVRPVQQLGSAVDLVVPRRNQNKMSSCGGSKACEYAPILPGARFDACRSGWLRDDAIVVPRWRYHAPGDCFAAASDAYT